MKWVLAAVFALATLSACGSGSKTTPTPSPAPTVVAISSSAAPAPTATPELSVYTVQRGDTLSGIAASTHRSMADIVKLNNIADPNKIAAGQKLLLPPAPTPAGTVAEAGSAQPIATAAKPPPP